MSDQRDAAALSHHGLFGYPSDAEELLRDPSIVGEFLRKKKATKERADVLRKLQILDEVIPQIVWTADPDGYQDYFNRHWFTYTGFTPAETYAGKTALHPDDFPLYVEKWANALKTGKAYEAEYRFRRASDGKYKWHLVRGVPIRDETGTIVKWLGTFTDIHDLKDTQKRLADAYRKLAAQMERLQTVIAIMPTGAIVVDESGTILEINESCRTIFSMPGSRQDWIGRNLRDFSAAAQGLAKDPEVLRSALAALRTDDPGDTKAEFHLRNDRVVVFEYFPIVESGDARGHLLLFRDVTRERRADAAKSEFMSLASHQLRTPLTSIRWALSWLSRQEEDAEVSSDIIRDARRAAVHMANTIDTMLSISRVEAGNMELSYENLDVEAALREILSRHEAACKEKELAVALEIGPERTVRADRKVLQEIIDNLVTNAIKYSKPGGTVTLRALPVSGGMQIDVMDDGLGIPRVQQEKVFSKFFRADNVLRVVTDGTGLGLYLASSLTKVLGGSLSFVSTEGVGTTFSLMLPDAAKG